MHSYVSNDPDPLVTIIIDGHLNPFISSTCPSFKLVLTTANSAIGGSYNREYCLNLDPIRSASLQGHLSQHLKVSTSLNFGVCPDLTTLSDVAIQHNLLYAWGLFAARNIARLQRPGYCEHDSKDL